MAVEQVSDLEARLKSALQSSYRIERELGAGGMATVYLARDVRHHRQVAIKVLRTELAAVIGAERFLAEIQTTANLHHPHILGLIDSGEVSGIPYYVMPFVDGESLRQRLEHERQLPIDDALRIAREVADGLAHAHSRGVVHRDIKPENILLQGGHALIADFGIALAVLQAGGQRLTQTGLSLGTPAYMSPEQAMGEREITARSDVYALGAVTYEMLTGEAPFTGVNAQAIVGKVLTEKPASVIARRNRVPPHVEEAVFIALEKLPADRHATAAEFAAALAGPSRDRAGARPRLGVPRVTTALALACAVATAAAIAGWARRPTVVLPPPVRFSIPMTSEKAALASVMSGPRMAISPDGRYVAFAGASTLERQIYVRALSDSVPRAVAGTEGAYQLAFSPDGGSIAFVAGNVLKKVELSTGRVTTICSLPHGNEQTDGVAWGDNDTVIVVQGRRNQVTKASASGGAPVTLRLALDTSATGQPVQLFWPDILPGSEYAVVNVRDPDSRLQILSLRTGERTDLLPRVVFARYAHPGHLLVQNEDLSVSAVPFDASSRRITGPATLVLPAVYQGVGNSADLAVSRTGILAYVPGAPRRVVVAVHRDGRAEVVIGKPGAYDAAKFSPDGRRIVVSEGVGTRRDLWMYDVERATMSRMTFESDNFFPVWSPDGRRVAFTSRRSGPAGIYMLTLDGSAEPERLVNTGILSFSGSFAADGRTFYYRRTDPKLGFDIFALDVRDTTHAERPILQTRFNEAAPMVSPNGRLLAYVSDESGRNEVYVRSTGGDERRWLITTDGGGEPLWRRDGKELFFRRSADVFAVPVDGGDIPQFGTAVRLFSGSYVGGSRWTGYDVAPDGRFLMVRNERTDERIDVITDWTSLLRSIPADRTP